MNWIEKETVDSTNMALYRLVKQGMCRYPVALIAEQQTSGRGRRSRIWHSEKGGLYFSYCPGAVEFQDILIQPLKIAAAIHKYIVKETSVKGFRVKWPNDIYYGGKKVAGVLSRTLSSADGHFVVTGAGVNIINHPPVATSCSLGDIFPEWNKSPRSMAMEIIRIAAGFSERKEVVDYINTNLLGKNTVKTVHIDGDKITGVIRGMGMDLSLEIEVQGTLRTITMGEVL